MSYPELLRLLARVDLAEDAAARGCADLVLAALTPAELDALGELERAARRN